MEFASLKYIQVYHMHLCAAVCIVCVAQQLCDYVHLYVHVYLVCSCQALVLRLNVWEEFQAIIGEWFK